MPDLFVPEDTTGYTSYYINVVNNGLIRNLHIPWPIAIGI